MMSEFFRPWRRKLGVLTLGLACLFFALWIRSLMAADSLSYRSGEKTLRMIRSSRTGLLWQTYHEGEFQIAGGSNYNARKKPFGNPLRSSTCLWSRTVPGFEFGELKPPIAGVTIGAWFIQYSSLVIPLTLFSAFLLLSKPRKSIQKKIVEPIPIEGK